MDLTLKLLDEDEIRGYVSRWQSFFWRRNMMALQEKSVSATKQLDWRSERMDGPSWMCHHKKYVSFCVFWGWSVGAEWEDQRKSLSVQSLDKLENSFCLKKNSDGVASVSFRNPERVDYYIQTLDGCDLVVKSLLKCAMELQIIRRRSQEKGRKGWKYGSISSILVRPIQVSGIQIPSVLQKGQGLPE